MEFKKLSAPSLKELFIQQMENLILSGELKIGDKLPPERQLADAMQVSRSVVNSGIVELERKGFLVIQPRIGTFIADYRHNGTLDTLLAIMEYNGGTLRDEEVRSILELRIAFDTLSIQHCISRITDADVEHLLEYVEQIHNNRDIHNASMAAYQFQLELAMLSGNTLLPLIFRSFEVPIFTLWHQFCSIYGTTALYENTYRLWSHIKDRNADAAIEWITKSINASISGNRPIYF